MNIHELRKKLTNDGELIKGYKWTETKLRCDMDAMEKAHDNKIEGLEKICANQLSRITLFEKDVKTSHGNEMGMQRNLKPPKRKQSP